MDRRRFVQGIALAGAAGSVGFRPSAAAASPANLSGSAFDLTIAETPVNITGRPRLATSVNGTTPGPALYWREGDTVTMNVINRLKEPTSIHWHGLRVPAEMDGVPGLSFRGIAAGETFSYRFPVKQTGTYWYHSHSGMQEQTGLYGALVLLPRGADPHPYDREHVILLSDWTDADPMSLLANLKQQSDYYNHGQRTVADLAREVKRDGLGATWRERSMWARMRMAPTDILDVTGATYTYLVNGASPRANWTGLFAPGERVRLRIINASSMTIFDVRIPGLKMDVVQTDGHDIQPVEVDQFRIGVAETYDVIVRPKSDRAYTLFAQAMDRSGYARATLAPRMGMTAPIPPMDPRPVRTMTDMRMGGMAGMKDMKGTGGGAGAAPMGAHTMADMPGMTMTAPAGGHPPLPVSDASGVTPGKLKRGVSVASLANEPPNRLGEAGDGLDGDGRRTLLYTDLRSLTPAPDPREPGREIVFHLTGNMERFTWGFDGKKFADAPPVRLTLGERVRFVLVNDTMMEHPIHLHGLFSELENGQDPYRPRKHTVLVKPGERLSYLVSADTPGHWAFHCHLLYHMEAGMFRTVVVA